MRTKRAVYLFFVCVWVCPVCLLRTYSTRFREYTTSLTVTQDSSVKIDATFPCSSVRDLELNDGKKVVTRSECKGYPGLQKAEV